MPAASTASVVVSKVRRSMRLVSHAVSGEPMHKVIAPKVIRSPAAWMLIPSPADNSGSIPAGASTELPVTILPSIRAVGVKRPARGFSMQMHVAESCGQLKGLLEIVGAGAGSTRAFSWKCPIAQAESPDISLVPAYLRSFAGVSFRRKAMSDQPKSESGFQYSLSNLKPVTPSLKITLTFPDGAQRQFDRSITGLEIAKGISPSLAKRTVAMALDGEVADLDDPIETDAKIEFVTRDDPRALELIRHDCAHVLAEAVQSLWPGTQVTIGPVIENGFYYDFFRNEPFTPEDFAAIEKKMRELIARDKPFTKEVWEREKTKQVFRDKGETFKVELVDAIPGTSRSRSTTRATGSISAAART